MPTWLYFILGFIALMVGMIIWKRCHMRRIARSRAGETFETFRSSIDSISVPEYVLLAVYAKLQDWCSGEVASFPVRAADHIADVYGMVDEDLDDAVLEVLAETKRKVPLQGMDPVNTVRDFALFVSACLKEPT